MALISFGVVHFARYIVKQCNSLGSQVMPLYYGNWLDDGYNYDLCVWLKTCSWQKKWKLYLIFAKFMDFIMNTQIKPIIIYKNIVSFRMHDHRWIVSMVILNSLYLRKNYVLTYVWSNQVLIGKFYSWICDISSPSGKLFQWCVLIDFAYHLQVCFLSAVSVDTPTCLMPVNSVIRKRVEFKNCRSALIKVELINENV